MCWFGFGAGPESLETVVTTHPLPPVRPRPVNCQQQRTKKVNNLHAVSYNTESLCFQHLLADRKLTRKVTYFYFFVGTRAVARAECDILAGLVQTRAVPDLLPRLLLTPVHVPAATPRGPGRDGVIKVIFQNANVMLSLSST